MSYLDEYRPYIHAIVEDYNDHPDFFQRVEDARYIKCASEGDCDEEVENEGDLCKRCAELQATEDAFQLTR